ncbi:hypothetical protein RJ639_036844 [Escallonia herrerae]|uniref:Alpha-N-acetylglucosaminidase n=1 Tax=Escallonia herrerae TaxID=1293975 RepID=A0AA88WQF6_9ASTE|nr:hypothetical protein RJ639_036844 [Escallonia herrerae]
MQYMTNFFFHWLYLHHHHHHHHQSPSEAIEALLTRLDTQRSSPSVQESAAKAVLYRLLPTHSSSFEFKIVSKVSISILGVFLLLSLCSVSWLPLCTIWLVSEGYQNQWIILISFSSDVCGGLSCFWITNYENSSRTSAEILIKGTTAVEITSGLHWYLKYWCGAHVSWDKTGGSQIASIPNPGSLPLVKTEGVRIQRPIPWNYYQNVVTSSYSYVWWDWKRWEKELDWMALQGVNLPLAFTGQESIWQKVFMGFNISRQDLDDFFGGPAFLAWARMGNLHGTANSVLGNCSLKVDEEIQMRDILFETVNFPEMVSDFALLHGNCKGDKVATPRITLTARVKRTLMKFTKWGGPLSQNWLDQQLVLQKQILSRMIELGMTPVLPSFAGNVPAALKKIYPTANITRLGEWNTVDGDPRWCCTFLLDPSDPLFIRIGEAFMRQQIKEYGDVTDIYNCDTFNENSPPTSDPTYISSLGSAVYEAMSKVDKDAVWLMQGWLFYSDTSFWKPPQMKALLHSVPFGKMIVLDLFADAKPIWKSSSQFYGTPYVWCMLHNFGGNIEMYGILDAVASGPIDARRSENSTMEWLKTYTRRRYGKTVNQIEAAWEILHLTVYNCTDGIADHNTDFIVKFPDWDPSLDTNSHRSKSNALYRNRRFFFSERSSALPQPHQWYSTQDVIDALRLFLDARHNLSGSLTYRYDLVDLTRQALSKLANQVYLDAVIAFHEKDGNALRFHGQKFLQLVKDIDKLLAADDNFLLGTWLESAKRLALNPSEMKQYEWNARTQVTMWFDNTKSKQSQLHDYANKFWSGLLEGYYLPRASMYFNRLSKSLRENEDFELEEWRKEWIAFSNKWQAGTELYAVKAQGDALALSSELYKKYFH